MICASRIYLYTAFFSLLFLIKCATDPGSGTPVAGGAVTFTYESGNVRVITSLLETEIRAAAVLFDINLVTGLLEQATSIEDGVTVTWPEDVSFELPGCSSRPNLSGSTTYPLFKIFSYNYPSNCSPSEVSGQATLIIDKPGFPTRTINDSSSGATELTFTSSGTFTAPSGVTSVLVECWGGGGGGGGGGGAPGGGGGAYARKSVPVTPGNTYTVTVGSGGAKGLTSPISDGADGGDSWFSTAGTVLASGGFGGDQAGGFPGGGGMAGTSIGDTTYSGGNGGGHLAALGGGGGSSAGTSSNGNPAVSDVPGAAPSGGGAGGLGGPNAVAGEDGMFPGGGGGGGGNLADGGVGGNGKVIVDW